MNRRNVFLAMLMAPFAAFASSSKEASGRGKVVRVICCPGRLSQEAYEHIQRSVNEAIDNDKVIVLEEGMTYHEFYGEPGPVVIADAVKYAYSYEVDSKGEFFNFTAYPVDANGVIAINGSDSGKELRVVIDPSRRFTSDAPAYSVPSLAPIKQS